MAPGALTRTLVLGLKSYLRALREALAPCFAEPSVENALVAKTFSQGYVTMQTLFGLLMLLQIALYFIADGDAKRLRISTQMLGFVVIAITRHLHRPEWFPNQARAASSWQTIAAVVVATTIPLSKLACPHHTAPPILIAAIHLVAVASTRFYHFTLVSRLLIHVGIFTANVENSYLLTGCALMSGEIVGSIFEHDVRTAFWNYHNEVQTLLQKDREDMGRHELQIAEQERLLEALRQSNERREFEICMMRREGWQRTHLVSCDKGSTTTLPTGAPRLGLSDCATESDMPLGAEAAHFDQTPSCDCRDSDSGAAQRSARLEQGAVVGADMVGTTGHLDPPSSVGSQFSYSHDEATSCSSSSITPRSHHTAKLSIGAVSVSQEPSSASSDARHSVDRQRPDGAPTTRWRRTSNLLRARRSWRWSSSFSQP